MPIHLSLCLCIQLAPLELKIMMHIRNDTNTNEIQMECQTHLTKQSLSLCSKLCTKNSVLSVWYKVEAEDENDYMKYIFVLRNKWIRYVVVNYLLSWNNIRLKRLCTAGFWLNILKHHRKFMTGLSWFTRHVLCKYPHVIVC